MKKKILNTKYQIPARDAAPARHADTSHAGWQIDTGRQNTKSGFTLIELLVAIFIFSIIVVGIISVFVSSTSAYSKARAIKTVKENVEYAQSLIAKDVRMGKIEKDYKVDNGASKSFVGTVEKYFVVTRNRGGKVCYRITEKKLGIQDGIGSNNSCSSSNADYKDLVDLSNVQMSFDIDSSGFSACPSTFNIESKCPLTISDLENRRGWVQINLNVNMTGGQEMEADQINVQTVVSSRDYGWESYAPS